MLKNPKPTSVGIPYLTRMTMDEKMIPLRS